MELDEKTRVLLKQKGLRCICEICDCGRPHKHKGCTKQITSVKSAFKYSDAKTDYQEKFGDKQRPSIVKSMKPLPVSLNPNPPVMDFRTTNRLHFKTEKMEERTKPCKLLSEYEGLTGPFYGDSVYKVDFPSHKPLPVKIERPKTHQIEPDMKLDARTMYMNAFEAKKQSKQDAFQELPSFAYSILYPDRSNPIDKISFKNQIHAGKFAARPGILAPKESTVKIGTEGNYEHVTTHNETFKKHADFIRDQPLKKSTDWQARPKFYGKTQAQDDFKGFGEKMPERRKPITPPPETINLAIDNHRYLETTKDKEHRVTWEKNKLHRPPPTKVIERYTPPKNKFQGLSVMQEDFQEHKNIQPIGIRPPEQMKSVDAKFSSKTSYNSQFPDYGRVNVSRYGDLYEKHHYVKPLNKFLQDDSVMRTDYKSHGQIKRVSPIVPENKRHTKGEKFYGETSYSQEYQPKDIDPCAFTKLLFELDAKKIHNSSDDVINRKVSTLSNIRKKRSSKLAASF